MVSTSLEKQMRFRIDGLDRETGVATTIVIAASSKSRAIQEASARGVLAERVMLAERVEEISSNLIGCPDCGRQVSRQAKACPNCGHPFEVAHDERAATAFRADEKRKKAAKSESRAQIALLLLTLGCAAVGALFLAPGSDRRGDNLQNIGIFALIAAFAFGAILIGGLPGSIARRRGHPNAQAITVCGWIGLLLTLSVFWWVALVWAHTNPTKPSL